LSTVVEPSQHQLVRRPELRIDNPGTIGAGAGAGGSGASNPSDPQTTAQQMLERGTPTDLSFHLPFEFRTALTKAGATQRTATCSWWLVRRAPARESGQRFVR